MSDCPVKPGDRVWYYFQHAFGRVEQIDEVAHIEVFTGKTEMRCRPARVVSVDAVTSAQRVDLVWEVTCDDIAKICGETFTEEDRRAIPVTTLGQAWLTIDVEFDDADRQLVPGGVVHRYDRRQEQVLSHTSIRGMGQLGNAWPEDNTWALQEKLAS